MSDRLLLDAMLGRLATYLRMCGYDAAYALDRGVERDDETLALARAEQRRIVTRDVELVARADGALLLDSTEITDQLRALRAAGYDLTLDEPTRCSACNGRLHRLSADDSTADHAPDPAEQRVWQCRRCGQQFWKGSHWDDVAETLSEL